tara:strand:- start:251 stop:499 length:249 start_codon:yes stop_codon:yes gene_type:complete
MEDLSIEGIEDVYSSKEEALKDLRRCHKSYYSMSPQSTADPDTMRKRMWDMIYLSKKRIEKVEQMEDWKTPKLSLWRRIFNY